MRRWATTLRQAAYDPSGTGQGSASSTTPLGLHLNYDMEFRSRRVGDIPQTLTSPLLPSFPILEKLRSGQPPPPPAAQQLEETDSPQSPSPDEEDGVDIKPHPQMMFVQFPFQKRKAGGQQRTPSKESTGQFGVSSDKGRECRHCIRRRVRPRWCKYLHWAAGPYFKQEMASGGRTIRCAAYKETNRWG